MHSRYRRRRMNTRSTSSNCESSDPANTLTDRLNKLLNSSGPRYTLSLCPGEQYTITAPILFAAPNQEIRTVGYPTDSDRAMLIVGGPVTNGTGHTTAVDGTCSKCSGVKLRNVQINGARLGAPLTSGGANIEIGGPNSNQLIEYVHSFDPRGWSCLHVAEGSLNCNNVTVQNNDIGPAGSSAYRQHADGISVACRNSLIRNNMVNNPTNGGIVLFGSPGTRVENNTIWVETQTLLGGINLVDVRPFGGNFTGVVVTNNTIASAFASQNPVGSEIKGTNAYGAVIKIGIAIGPRTWFGNHYGNNVSTGGTVVDNQLTGAFSYGMAMSSVTNFTVENNVLIGNTSFIGSRGPNCTTGVPTPPPSAFVIDLNSTQKSTIQATFTPVSSGDSLISVVVPPNGGDYWPFSGNASSTGPPAVSPPETSVPTSASHASSGVIIAIVVGVILYLALAAVATWFVHKWTIKRSQNRIVHLSRPQPPQLKLNLPGTTERLR